MGTMGSYNEHETELDLMDGIEELEGDEAEDRGDELTDDQLAEQEDDELDTDDEDSDENDADADADADDSDDDGDDVDAGGKGSRVVPHSRFNEVNEQYKQERDARLKLEEELARLRGASGQGGAQQQDLAEGGQASAEAAADYDFDAAEERYTAAIYDGELEEAKKIRAEIRAQERQAAEAAAEALLVRKEAESVQRQQQEALKSVVSKAVESYPFLDAQGEQANQDAIDEVVALRNVYLQRGMSPAAAIEKAVEKVGPRYAEEDEAPVKPTRTSRKEIIERNMKRSERIPASGEGVGERARSTDYSALSDGEFRSMSEEEKRKARGDYL